MKLRLNHIACLGLLVLLGCGQPVWQPVHNGIVDNVTYHSPTSGSIGYTTIVFKDGYSALVISNLPVQLHQPGIILKGSYTNDCLGSDPGYRLVQGEAMKPFETEERK